MKTFLRMLLGQFGVLLWQAFQRLDDRKVFDRAVELAMVYVAKLERVPATEMNGPAKLESATTSIQSDLQSVGMSLAKDMIQMAISAALTALRSKGGASAS